MKRWKQIKGHENYLISTDGEVSSLKRGGKLLKLDYSRSGYPSVTLSDGGVTSRYLVHRLVALTFIPNPLNYPFINHKDSNRRNPNVDNLEWCTCRQNTVHAFDVGARPVLEDHVNTIRTNDQIHEVCRLIESGLVRGEILMRCPFISKASFDDIRSRKTWKRISNLYKW